MSVSLVYSCTTWQKQKKTNKQMKALADLPSSSFFLIGEEMFLMDLPLEDKWEHSNFCGLEINVHKARKMGNVIKQIVYTVCELREKKKKSFYYPELSWQTAALSIPTIFPTLTGLDIYLSFKTLPFLPQCTVLVVALQWSQICIGRSLVLFWMLPNYFFKKIWSTIIFFSVFEIVAHTLYAKFFIFLF